MKLHFLSPLDWRGRLEVREFSVFEEMDVIIAACVGDVTS